MPLRNKNNFERACITYGENEILTLVILRTKHLVFHFVQQKNLLLSKNRYTIRLKGLPKKIFDKKIQKCFFGS